MGCIRNKGNIMNITESMLSALREQVKPYLTEKRYGHTIAVEAMAEKLAALFLPEKIGEARAAALLHDITKKADLEKQLQYCAEFGIMVSEEDIAAPKLFHARTAAELIKRDFPDFATEEVTEAVRWHTTGRAGMTMLESIVYLADYIEETRTFPDCVTLRQYFFTGMEETKAREEREAHLIKTMIMSFDMTIRCLLEEDSLVDRDTIAARNALVLKSRTYLGRL